MSNNAGGFVGRQRELDQFSDALSGFGWLGRLRARSGGQSGTRPRVFLAHGREGIGKTWLGQKCLSLARDKGWKTIELDLEMAGLRPNEPLDLMDAIAEALRDRYGARTVKDYLKARGRVRQAHETVERLRAENQNRWQEFLSGAQEVTEGGTGGAKDGAAGLLSPLAGALGASGALSLAKAEESFLNWAVGQGQLDEDDKLLYQDGYTRLADRLARALTNAARKRSLAVQLDGCETLPVELEAWLRDAIIHPSVREPVPSLFVVSGRPNHTSEGRQEDAKGQQGTVEGDADRPASPPPVSWDITRLTRAEMRDYLEAHDLSTDYEWVDLVQDVSRGIPLALWIAVDIAQRRGREPTRDLFPLNELSGLSDKELVRRVTRRFLHRCLDQEADRTYIYSLAALRHPDLDTVAALWDLPEGNSPRAELMRLADRYAFVGSDGRLHDVVAEVARDDLRHSKSDQICELGRRVAELYGTRWQTATAAIPHLGDRLEDRAWCELTLDYLNGLLWQNGQEARAFLAARFAEATIFNWGLARALVNLAAPFAKPQDWWPLPNHTLLADLRQAAQAAGLDEAESLRRLLEQSQALGLGEIQQACLHCRVAQVLNGADQSLQALDACRESEALLPDDPTLRTQVAELFGRIGWDLCVVGRRVVPSDGAQRAFREAIALQPDRGGHHVGLAVALHGLRRNTEALSALKKGIELQGEQAYSLNWLGNVYGEQGETEQAIAAYQRAIELDPDYASPHYNLGNIYRERRDYGQALAAYQCAVELDPNDASLHNNLGIVCRERGDYGQALAAYQRAIELEPSFASAHNNLGIV